jgi:spore germination protein KB
MRDKNVTFTQAVFTLVLFATGSSTIIGISGVAEQDDWLSLFIATAMAVPLLLMYSRIMRLFPETDLFDILETLFGKLFGKVLVALITWYALHLCSLVLRNFSEFFQIVAFAETPQLPMMIALMLVTAYLAISGEKALGKWSVIMLPIVIFTILLTVVMAISDIDFTFLQPFFAHGWQTILSGAYQIVTFPLAETVLFLGIAGAVKKDINPYKMYGLALLINNAIFLVIILRNITILGVPMINASYFPSYSTARILHVGDIVSRIEGSITMNFLLAGITKITLCLIVAAKGIAKLFAIEDYKRMIMPSGMLVVALCAIVFKSTMEMIGFIQYYQIYAIPFQMFIPAAVWITAEINRKMQTKKRLSA